MRRSIKIFLLIFPGFVISVLVWNKKNSKDPLSSGLENKSAKSGVRQVKEGDGIEGDFILPQLIDKVSQYQTACARLRAFYDKGIYDSPEVEELKEKEKNFIEWVVSQSSENVFEIVRALAEIGAFDVREPHPVYSLLSQLVEHHPEVIVDLVQLKILDTNCDKSQRIVRAFPIAFAKLAKINVSKAVSIARKELDPIFYSGGVEYILKTETLMASIAAVDLNAALSLRDELKKKAESQKKKYREFLSSIIRVASIGTNEERDTLLTLIRSHGSGSDIQGLVGRMTAQPFEVYSDWLLDQEFSIDELNYILEIARTGFFSYAYHSSKLAKEPGEWLCFVNKQQGEERFEEIRHNVSSLMDKWTREDLPAAGEWLETLQEGKLRDTSIQSYATRVLPHDPDVARVWVDEISDVSIRVTLLQQIAAYEAKE